MALASDLASTGTVSKYRRKDKKIMVCIMFLVFLLACSRALRYFARIVYILGWIPNFGWKCKMYFYSIKFSK